MFTNARKIAEQRAGELIAGHCTLITWWALRQAGVLEAMVQCVKDGEAGLEPLVHATRTSMSAEVLDAMLEYLSRARLVEYRGVAVRLTAEGAGLFEHGDTVLQMVRAYQPVLEMSEHLLAKLKAYGGSSNGGALRKSDYLTAAQAEHYAAEVYPAVKDVIAGQKAAHLLDISCGTGQLLIHVIKKMRQVVGVGIGFDPLAVRKANAAISKADLEKRLIAVTADPRDVCVETQKTFDRIGISRQLWNGLDCVIAMQVFSAIGAAGAVGGADGRGAIVKALMGARKHFSKARLMVIEPVMSPRFEKNFYASELSLLMKLTGSSPWPAERWRETLGEAKWKVTDEKALVTDGLTIFCCTAL